MTRIALFDLVNASVLLIAGAMLGISSASAADAAQQTAMLVTMAEG